MFNRRSSLKFLSILIICFNFCVRLFPYNDFPGDNVNIAVCGSSSSIEQILETVSPYAAAFAVVKQLFSCFGSSGSHACAPDNVYSLISKCENVYSSAFAYGGEVLQPEEAAQLKNFYDRLSDYEKTCAPFYIDQFEQFRVRSFDEVIRNFCAESTKYLCDIRWDSPEVSLSTLYRLEEQIYHSHGLRKYKVRPLGKVFKNKEYINELIQNYKRLLRGRIDENRRQGELEQEKRRLEEERRESERLEHERIERERLKQECLAQEMVEAEWKENLARKEEWSSRHEPTKGSGTTGVTEQIEEQLLDLQNTKEIIEWSLSRRSRTGFSKQPAAQLGFKLIDACEHELIMGNEQAYFVHKRRLQAVVKTLRNEGRRERREYEITKALRSEASSWGMVLDRLGAEYCNALQHDIYQESLELLNQTADAKQAFFDVEQITAMADLVAESACAANEYSQAREYEQGYRVLDFAASVYGVLGETGKFVYLSAKGITKGCYRAGTLPFSLAKNLLTAPVETVSGIVGGISSIAGCLFQGIWESITLSGEKFAQSKTAARFEVISSYLGSMSYEEKIEEGTALVTELLFPAALSKIKFVPRMKRLGGALRKVLRGEKKVVRALKAEEVGVVVQRAGGPVSEAVVFSEIKKTNPLSGTKYTSKVLADIKRGDYHSFPKLVDNFGGLGNVSKIVGGDGVVRTKVEICGAYRGKAGVFEYIIEPDGYINHRLFRATKC